MDVLKLVLLPAIPAFMLFGAVLLCAIRAEQARTAAARAANAPDPAVTAAHYAADAARMTADGLTYDSPGFVRRTP